MAIGSVYTFKQHQKAVSYVISLFNDCDFCWNRETDEHWEFFNENIDTDYMDNFTFALQLLQIPYQVVHEGSLADYEYSELYHPAINTIRFDENGRAYSDDDTSDYDRIGIDTLSAKLSLHHHTNEGDLFNACIASELEFSKSIVSKALSANQLLDAKSLLLSYAHMRELSGGLTVLDGYVTPLIEHISAEEVCQCRRLLTNKKMLCLLTNINSLSLNQDDKALIKKTIVNGFTDTIMHSDDAPVFVSLIPEVYSLPEDVLNKVDYILGLKSEYPHETLCKINEIRSSAHALQLLKKGESLLTELPVDISIGVNL